MIKMKNNNQLPEEDKPKQFVNVGSSIIGKTIENEEGEKLGIIKDIMVNLYTGKIEYIVMETGGFLKLNHKLFAIPYHEIYNHPEENKFLVNRNKEFINNAPGFDQDHWPCTNSNYKSLETYWGNMGTAEINTDTTGPGRPETGSGTLDPF